MSPVEQNKIWLGMKELFICILARQSRPEENDRTELLKQAEPLDYSGDMEFEDFSPAGATGQEHNNTYQLQPVRQPKYNSTTRSKGPPRGIFDDI